MSDKELLAELKISYNYLQDIIDNADNTQLKSVKELIETQNILSKKYNEIYENIKEKNINLCYGEHFKIGSNIYVDYEDNENICYSYADLENEIKWWEDYRFLTD